ncbi:MAG: methyl-accepting chemotaxis protein [Lachnospiraceae bacterium]|nr:methyl-accepting chemotaxis protein [Lachnospiraceae bacterium]
MFLKKLVSLDAEKLHNYSFKKKFAVSFKRMVAYMIVAVIALVVTVILATNGLATIYKTYYTEQTLQAEIRIDMQALTKSYLWALSAKDESVRDEQLKKASEKYTDFDSNLAALKKVYTGKEDLSQISKDLKNAEEEGTTLQKMFEDGAKSDEIFTQYNDKLYPAIDVSVQDFKKISTEITEQADSHFNFVIFIVSLALVVTVLVVVVTLIYVRNMRRQLEDAIVVPVEELKEAASLLAQGKLKDITITYESEDELGELADDIKASTKETEEIVNDISETLDRVAGGDFTHGSEHAEIYINDYNPIKVSLDDITSKLAATLGMVKDSSSRVSDGALNMREGANGLAEGATDQAAAIEELTASVQTVSSQTQDMADSANRGSSMVVQVKDDVEVGAEKMSRVTDAMSSITTASNEIATIANTIQDIASQTALLSLNASIEAARAGEAGRGFAVVAEEISNLAQNSSEAAKHTQDLINDTLREIEDGNAVVTETQDALMKVKESVDEVVSIIQETGEIASSQSESMKEISEGIEQISGVIQANTATAQQSSAVSQQLSDQSENLNHLIDQFKI